MLEVADLPDELYFRFVYLGCGVRYLYLFDDIQRRSILRVVDDVEAGLLTAGRASRYLALRGYVDVVGYLRTERPFWAKLLGQELRYRRGRRSDLYDDEDDVIWSCLEHLGRIL